MLELFCCGTILFIMFIIGLFLVISTWPTKSYEKRIDEDFPDSTGHEQHIIKETDEALRFIGIALLVIVTIIIVGILVG